MEANALKSTHTLIVNPNGLLSACPTHEQFEELNYITERMTVREVTMDEDTYVRLWHSRDSAYVLADGLPDRVDDPGRVYFKVVNDRLIAA